MKELTIWQTCPICGFKSKTARGVYLHGCAKHPQAVADALIAAARGDGAE